MPLADRFLALPRALANRFGSKASRFQLAVTAGFAVTAVGFLTVTVSDRSGFADIMWGSMSFFGNDAVAPQAAAPADSMYAPRHHARHRLADRSRARANQDVTRVRDADSDAPMELGRKSMCVRLCDGFAFPIGAYHGDQDRASHEATCQSECPGAATALYVVPSGSDSISDAVQVDTRKSYSEMPFAFHYTTVLSDACSCHPASGGRIASLLRDFTLRRGDAVMTAAGFKVFHGGSRYPYRRTDFVALSRSPDVRKAARPTFLAIERASLKSAPNIVAQEVSPASAAPRKAETAGPKPVKAKSAGAADAAKPLERQASLTPAPSAIALP